VFDARRNHEERLTAAIVGGAMLAGGVIIGNVDVASAGTIHVCKREVLDPVWGTWLCVEWTTCEFNPDTLEYACDDGIYGGPSERPTHGPVLT
jgi:hypothetical protein